MKRRLKVVSIDRRFIESLPYIDTILLKDGTPLKIKGIPEDVKLLDWHINRLRQSLDLILEHETFLETPEGAEPEPSMYTHETKYWIEVIIE